MHVLYHVYVLCVIKTEMFMQIFFPLILQVKQNLISMKVNKIQFFLPELQFGSKLKFL